MLNKEKYPKLRLAFKCAIGHKRRIKYQNPRINHNYKCIFVHIPKTAGSSVTRAMNSLERKSDQKSPRIGKHAKAYEIKYLLGQEIWEEYFSFAFVRNPWDLMVSSYYWWLQKAPKLPAHRRTAERIRRMPGFRDFIESTYGREMINERFGTIFDWISENERIIVDYVGKVENIGKDWIEICKHIGITAPAIPHLNQTNRRDYRDYYSDESREIVAKRFHRTIDRFGYTF